MTPSALHLVVDLALHEPTAGGWQRATEAARGPLDLERLLRYAHQHRLRPMLARHLTALGDSLPPGWAPRLREEVRRGAMRAHMVAAELVLLQRSLRAAGVQSLAVKGPALGVLAHGTPVLRSMADLDLAIRPSDLVATRRCLSERGYLPMPLVDGQVCSFGHPTRRLVIEIHLRLDKSCFPFFPLPDSVWNAPEQVLIVGEPVDVLPLELHARYLIYHGSRHLWFRLGWLAVLADLLRRQMHDLDGEALVRDAAAAGNRGMVSLTATLMAKIWPDIPPLLPVPQVAKNTRTLAGRVSGRWATEERQPGSGPLGLRFASVLRNVRDMAALADSPLVRWQTAWRVGQSEMLAALRAAWLRALARLRRNA